VDMKDDVAYIADSGVGSSPLHAGLIVYQMRTNTARRILNQANSTQPEDQYRILINGEKVFMNEPLMTGADGIALTKNGKMLYYCPMTGDKIYSIPTALLKNFSTPLYDIDAAVQVYVNKKTTSDGLACSNEDGVIYISSLEKGAVLRYDGKKYDSISDKAMIWPDTFGFDHHGSIIFTTNSLHKFVDGRMDFSIENFYIWSVYIGADSYME